MKSYLLKLIFLVQIAIFSSYLIGTLDLDMVFVTSIITIISISIVLVRQYQKRIRKMKKL